MTTIDITYSAVAEEVKRQLEYIGLKSGAYDKIRAIDEDKDQLEYWYINGVAIVGVVLDRLITKKQESDGGRYIFTVACDNARKDMIQKVAIRYIAAHMLVKWLQITAPELLQLHTTDEAEMMKELERLAYYREMPK